MTESFLDFVIFPFHQNKFFFIVLSASVSYESLLQCFVYLILTYLGR